MRDLAQPIYSLQRELWSLEQSTFAGRGQASQVVVSDQGHWLWGTWLLMEP